MSSTQLRISQSLMEIDLYDINNYLYNTDRVILCLQRLIVVYPMVPVSLSTLTYRVSQEECTKLRKSVPYVELYRYNPKHLYPKLNGYGDNGQRSLKL